MININKLFNGLDKSEKRTAQTSKRQDGQKKVIWNMTAPVTVRTHMNERRQKIKKNRSYSDTDKPSQGEHGVMTRVTPTAMSQEVGDE